MIWRPAHDTCPECAFVWSMPVHDAIELVEDAGISLGELMDRHHDWRTPPADGVWSPSSYLWHLVDVLRIGTERLVTLTIAPEHGLPGWDADALAEVRQYARLSPRAGLQMYVEAARMWTVAARKTPEDATTQHAVLGTMSRAEVVRRNAHEVHHHLRDIRAGLCA